MSCPEPIARVLLELLDHAVMLIRSAGWSNDPRRCALEADHIHNLPHLLLNFSEVRLRYYWEVERPSYLSQCELMGQTVLPEYVHLWDELRKHLP